jgi:hypothetical protein
MNQTGLIIQQNSAELQYLCTVISTDGSENGEDKWLVLDPINYSYGEFTYLDPFRLYSRLLSFLFETRFYTRDWIGTSLSFADYVSYVWI